MLNYFEASKSNLEKYSKKPEHKKEGESEFQELILQTCYNRGCEVINEDEFVRKSLLEINEHDKNTFLHSLEVGNMMAFVINKMGDKFDEREKQTLMMSALLHDYGKTSIDAQILNKRGQLSEEERKIIEEHPRYSFEALKEWDEEVAKVTVAHHEHQAHSYPRKQYVEDILDKRNGNGDQVRKLSRILAIVDSFQAMIDPTRPSNRGKNMDIHLIVKELNEKKFILNEDKEVLFLLEEYYYQSKDQKEDRYKWN
ncbi:MAG: HD domain-containing phosphohydrolase [Candidatus Moraniibacteriota bacterium]